MPQDTQKWGKTTAKSRYGTTPTFSQPPADSNKPQCPEDKQGPGYENSVPSNWLRGMPNAEGKPGFDKSGK